MSASSSLSVEIWQKILRHAIFVPDFLDPDSFEGDLRAHGFGDLCHSRQDESVYWEVERRRNGLLRVCKSWHQYLLTFEHRFVRMSDIWHGQVDVMAVKKAVRITFHCPDLKCLCEGTCAPYVANEGFFGLYKRFATFCAETIYSFTFLLAEIIDIGNGPDRQLWNSGSLRSLSKVQVIISTSFSGDGIDYPLFCQSPELRHVRSRIDDFIAYPVFVSSTLVTLSFEIRRENTHQNFVWDLPSLRYLKIAYGIYADSLKFHTKVLVPLLRQVGSQLRSLYVDLWDIDYEFPCEIWDLCPGIEKLRPGMKLTAPPPLFHPVHTLSVPQEHFIASYALSSKWPNLQRIILDIPWTRFIGRLDDIQRVNSGRGLIVEDRRGLLLEGYMNQTQAREANE